MVINSLMQSLNKRKIIYISVITGLLLNLIFDIPLMNLFHKLNLPAYYGAITATLIGFLVSNIMSMIYLNKEMKLDYKETILSIPRFIISIVILIISLKLFKLILPINTTSRLIQVFNLLISGIVNGGIYLIINFKSIKTLLPQKLLKKLKLTN